jgi:Ni,Fe-hydrogenase I cytochrome b subunit
MIKHSFTNFEKNYTMQEASFSGFFRMIVYMIGFYYLIKILSRIFLPVVMKNVMNKAQENFNRQQSQNPFNQGNTQDFQTSKTETPKPTKQVGDYIDYEEIE